MARDQFFGPPQKLPRLLWDSWEVDDENDTVVVRLFKRDGPPGNGHEMVIDGLGSMGLGRALLKHGATAEMTRQAMVEAAEERRRVHKRRRGFWRKDDKPDT